MNNQITKVLWAVDPFAEDKELQRRTAETINALNVAGEISVTPVSVLHWEDRYAVPEKRLDTIQEVQEAARQSVVKLATEFGVKNVLAPILLLQEDLSLNRAVRRLLQEARTLKTDLIALGTQAKKGTSRFLLGSFAESMILQSEIPVLVVSPKAKPLQKLKKIFFPTDFSEKSKEAFLAVVALAKKTGARINLFHRIDYVVYAPPTLISASHPDLAILEREKADQKKKAELLAKLAEVNGVKVDIVVEWKGGTTIDMILDKASSSESDLIAMVSQSSGPAEAFLLGSITRQVIRHSNCPVWVIHPKAKSK